VGADDRCNAGRGDELAFGQADDDADMLCGGSVDRFLETLCYGEVELSSDDDLAVAVVDVALLESEGRERSEDRIFRVAAGTKAEVAASALKRVPQRGQ
jgi:hypothetical protein